MCLFYTNSQNMYDTLNENLEQKAEMDTMNNTKTQLCVICLEDCYNNSIKLNCSHDYHEDCIIKYFIHQHKRKMNNITKRWSYNCPICRKHIKCSEIRHITFRFYRKLRYDYIGHKNDLDKTKSKLMWYSIKHNIISTFTKKCEEKKRKVDGKIENMMNDISNINYELDKKKEYIKSVYKVYVFFCGHDLYL